MGEVDNFLRGRDRGRLMCVCVCGGIWAIIGGGVGL